MENERRGKEEREHGDGGRQGRGGSSGGPMKATALVVLLLFAVGTLAWTLSGILAPKPLYTAAQAQRTFAAQNPLDKCATPAGYTDAAWRQHMGHHPDRYAECLG